MKRTLISLLLIVSFGFLTSLSAQTNESSETSTSETVDQALKKAEEKLDKLIGKFGKKRKKQGSMEAGESTSEDASSAPTYEEPREETPTYDDPDVNRGDENDGSDIRFDQPKTLTDVPPFPEGDFDNGPYTEKGVIGKGPYGTKAATWIKETTVKHTQMKMTVFQRDTLEFDDYGNSAVLHSYHRQTVSMMGFNNKQESLTISYTMNDSLYSYKHGESRGTKMEHPAKDFYEGMTEEQVEKFGEDMNEAMNNSITLRGTGYVGDKLCQVYDTEMRNEEGIVILRTRIWYWRGIALQTISKGMGIEEETTTKHIEAYNSLPGDRLNIPRSVNFDKMIFGY